MGGHPNFNESTKAIIALAEAGADIIELGVPFSDPIADGLVNQKAAEIAIENGANLEKVIEQVKQVRQLNCNTPILLFTYFNPILAFGLEKFCKAAKFAGVNGILIVDLPPEEGGDFYTLASQTGLEIVLLVSPTTDPARFPVYASLKPSFIYCISRLSVTGIQQDLSENLEEEIVNLRKHLIDHKIAVGFGISSIEQAKIVSLISDGVIIGSKLVSTLECNGIEEFKKVAKSFGDIIHGDF